ncbi:MAG: dihydrodipicolinate synthase family protein [Acidobacteriota bacterium]
MAATEGGLSGLRQALLRGLVIPAHPLALTETRALDERRQIALTRYYCDAGAGGIAVGVHTTQFAIRDAGIGLFEPVLQLAQRAAGEWCADRLPRPVMIAGVIGPAGQAMREAETAVALGYDAALLSVAALRDASNHDLLEHCARVARVIPIIGFYLQTAVGGRPLDRAFWRGFFEIDRVVAVKVAPFDRYATLDVTTALAESGRQDIALYTGNDDAIVADLLTGYPAGGSGPVQRFAGGLLGQWAVWTHRAVEILERCHAATRGASTEEAREDALRLLELGARLTDANAALFDPAHHFAGCIPGIHEVLRRQGLLAGRWCLDPREELSPGQMQDIDRALSSYPELTDDDFVREHLHRWLS